MTESATCPKCGNQRLEGSLDCPFCGIVYDRFDPARAGAPRAPAATQGDSGAREPQSPLEESLDGVYRGEAADGGHLYDSGADDAGMYQGPAAREAVVTISHVREAEPETKLGRALVDNIYLAILGAGLLYLFVTFMWNTRFLVVHEDVESASVAFFRTSGLLPPEGLRHGGALSFVGRNWVWFAGDTSSVPTLVLLHHRGRLARARSGAELASQFEGWLTELGLALRRSGQREEILGGFEGQLVNVQIFSIDSAGGASGSVALVPFIAQDGRAALLMLAAPIKDFNELYRQYLD